MQTTVTQYNDILQLGNIADTSLRQIDSYSAEGVVGIAKAVRRGTNPERQCAQASTAVGQGALIFGISVLSQTVEQVAGSGLVQYADKTTVPVMRKGRIVVQADSAVVAGSIANFVLATGNWDDTAVGAGIEATTLITVRFVTGTTAAGLAIVEIQNAA